MRKRIALSAKALIVWAVALVALLVGIAVWLSFRGFGPNELQLAGLAIAMIVLLGIIGSAITLPIFLAFREADGSVTFIWQYPYKRIVRRYSPDDIPEPSVERTVDSDGDPHFSARILFDDGLEFILAHPLVNTGAREANEGKRGVCEKACADFSDAVSSSAG